MTPAPVLPPAPIVRVRTHYHEGGRVHVVRWPFAICLDERCTLGPQPAPLDGRNVVGLCGHQASSL